MLRHVPQHSRLGSEERSTKLAKTHAWHGLVEAQNFEVSCHWLKVFKGHAEKKDVG
jgi:hypothetical protein